jgi:hypothetical protein
MIIINKGSVNTMIVTLLDKVTIANPYYLFVLESKIGEATVKAILTDHSQYPNRYQEFHFNEPDTIEIGEKGNYTYKFIQKATASTTILDTDIELETGIARVYE